MLIDSHSHLTYPELSSQIDGVLERAATAGVRECITIATSPADARRAVELIRGRPGIHIAAGIHPHEAGRAGEEECAALTDFHLGLWKSASEVPVTPVAVGETGLDFHYDFAPRDAQERIFRFQLELAIRVNRPVIIHARKAEEQVCDILAEYPGLAGRVVFHCFSREPAIARRILDMGLWLSFTGVVTFDNAAEIRESALYAPADRIMVETDAPYLSPRPVRKIRPCEPAFVAHTARFLAELRGTPLVEFAAATTANTRAFFGLAPA